MRITSIILSLWLSLFAALPTVYGTACTQDESTSCCVDDHEEDTNDCCDENSAGTCCSCHTVFIAVLNADEYNEFNFFDVRMDYLPIDNSFVSSYLNKPFHPPKVG